MLKYTQNDILDNLRKLYDYVRLGITSSELTDRINTAVEKGRKNEIWRTQYMKELVLLQDAEERGREKGHADDIEKLAKHYVSENPSLTIEKAREMAKKILD